MNGNANLNANNLSSQNVIDWRNKLGIGGQISNPNLLINGDFRVNQRGQNSYSTINKYTVDRWKLVSGSLTVETNGITLNGTITQTLEHEPSGTLTASSSAGTVSYSGGVFTLTTTEATLITWAKLEIGSVATPFSLKPYNEELLNCQRYYYETQGTNASGAFGIASNNYNQNIYQIIWQFPTTMRANPAVTMTGNWCINASNGVLPVSSLSFQDFMGDKKVIRANVSGAPARGNCAVFGKNNDGTAKITFDSEIY